MTFARKMRALYYLALACALGTIPMIAYLIVMPRKPHVTPAQWAISIFLLACVFVYQIADALRLRARLRARGLL